jgi:hypothetical protein
MNHRNAIPANGTRFSAQRTLRSRAGSDSHSPASSGRLGTDSRSRTRLVPSRTANRIPAIAADRGVVSSRRGSTGGGPSAVGAAAIAGPPSASSVGDAAAGASLRTDERPWKQAAAGSLARRKGSPRRAWTGRRSPGDERMLGVGGALFMLLERGTADPMFGCWDALGHRGVVGAVAGVPVGVAVRPG